MAVLKKIKASTLMETLVATVLLVVIFMLASMVLNNLFSNTIKGNTRDIEVYLTELEYLYRNDKIALPYDTDFGLWTISIEKVQDLNNIKLQLEAVNQDNQQTVKKDTHVN